MTAVTAIANAVTMECSEKRKGKEREGKRGINMEVIFFHREKRQVSKEENGQNRFQNDETDETPLSIKRTNLFDGKEEVLQEGDPRLTEEEKAMLAEIRKERESEKKRHDSKKENRKTGSEENRRNQRNPISQGLSDFVFKARKLGNDSLHIVFEALYLGRLKLEGSIQLTPVPWKIYMMYFHATTNSIALVDMTTISLAQNGAENTPDNYIGRILTTDSQALIYLRGRFDDIPGFRNVHVSDQETAASAFSKFSPSAADFMVTINKRLENLGKIDIFKLLCAMEFRLNVVSQVCLDLMAKKKVDPQVAKAVKELITHTPCDCASSGMALETYNELLVKFGQNYGACKKVLK